jgi:hypothetical protein
LNPSFSKEEDKELNPPPRRGISSDGLALSVNGIREKASEKRDQLSESGGLLLKEFFLKKGGEGMERRNALKNKKKLRQLDRVIKRGVGRKGRLVRQTSAPNAPPRGTGQGAK